MTINPRWYSFTTLIVAVACGTYIADGRKVTVVQDTATPAALIAAASRQPVVITGTATDCHRGNVIKIHSMEVVALDPSAHQELVSLLRTMDTVTWAGDGTEAMSRFEPMYGRMVDLLESSTPLARDTTTATGTFTLSIASADSVLVIADADLENTPRKSVV